MDTDMLGRRGLSLQEAARVLGLTEAATRKRLQRGYLRGYKVDGQWRLDLDGGDPVQVQSMSGQMSMSGPSLSASGPAQDPPGPSLSTSGPAGVELEAALREQVAQLKSENANVWDALRREQTASAELRRLLQQRLGPPPLEAALITAPARHNGRLRRLGAWFSRSVL